VDPVSKIIIPFFALIFCGYAAARRNWVHPSSARFQRISTVHRGSSTVVSVRFERGVRRDHIWTVLRRVHDRWPSHFLLVVAFARGVMGATLRDASFYGLAASATNIGHLAIPLLVALPGFIFAQRYESDVARISTALVASTALSAATFSALVWYLGPGMGTK